MIEIPVLDTDGKKIGGEQLDPELLGGRVRHDLLKQAVVAHRANRRQGTVQTKSRAHVHGSSRKLYKQKGTGRARAGNLRTPVRVGGGHAFHKINRDFDQKMNRKMRRLARNSAILAKALAGQMLIVDGLKFETPSTKKMAKAMKAVDAGHGALFTYIAMDANLVKSSRNIPTLTIKSIFDVNAYDVLKGRRLMLTPDAFQALVNDPVTLGRGVEA
ncbi:MAG TPA: 50S ribosomal protein L4 [Phycisphaerae bacterium]|nr:50S ribosomal protein L4 [Phycisphaerae bacterium]